MKTIPKVVGLTWFKDEGDFKKALSLFDNAAAEMPLTYEDFLIVFDEAMKKVRDEGLIPIKAEIDPESFLSWCRARNVKSDHWGRLLFCNETAVSYLRSRGFVD